MSKGEESRNQGTRRATVIGAGIAGMTAAHELVERGFTVVVYEADEATGPFRFERCDVGGMAKTQWSSMPRPTIPTRESRMERTLKPAYFDDEISFEVNQATIDASNADKIRGLCNEIAQLLAGGWSTIELRVIGFHDHGEQSSSRSPSIGEERARAVERAIVQALPGLQGRVVLHVSDGGSAPLLSRPGYGRSPVERRTVSIEMLQDIVPGEHGFRFFPGFYRHLFDTMKRTQIFEDVAMGSRGHAARVSIGRRETAFDRLRRTDMQEVRRDVSKSEIPPPKRFVLPRRPVKSFHEALTLSAQIVSILDIPAEDAARVQLKIFQFLTSCTKRRQELEQMTWAKYLGATSGKLYDYLNKSCRILLALDATEGDARTHGEVTIQLLLDQLTDGAHTDSVLVGPTTTEWLHPWRRYLEQQGVMFVRARVEAITQEGNFTFLDMTLDDGACPPTTKRVSHLGYVVVATDMKSAQALTSGLLLKPGDPDEKDGRADVVALSRIRIDDDHRVMTGIQYFFDVDTSLVAGHTVYLDSRWGLSAINQPQFWWRRRGWWDGYRGILSVDIANWEKVLEDWERSGQSGRFDDFVAKGAWKQIEGAYEPGGSRYTKSPDGIPFPKPIRYHLDTRTVSREAGAPNPEANDYLVPRAGRWHVRPGEVPDASGKSRYSLAGGSVVLAGSYMKTFTRITSMEAANESARHAVNAILDAENVIAPRCRIWPLDEAEPEDLRTLKALDEVMYERGLPHFVEVLGWTEVAEDLGSISRTLLEAVRSKENVA